MNAANNRPRTNFAPTPPHSTFTGPPTAFDCLPTVPDHRPAPLEPSPAVPAHLSTRPVRPPAASDPSTPAPICSPATPDRSPAAPDSSPAGPFRPLAVPNYQPATLDCSPAVDVCSPAVLDSSPTVPDHRPAPLDSSPAAMSNCPPAVLVHPRAVSITGEARPSRTRESGYVTAETALSLPSLLAVTFSLLLIVLAAGDQIRCSDAAWEAARLVARGEPIELAEAQVKRWMPSDTAITLAPDQGAIRATVSVRIGVGGALLPAVRISSSAQVTCEIGLPCATGGA